MSTTLDVLACGAVTPVGLSALTTHVAMRAGIAAFSESSFFQNTLPPKAHQASSVPRRRSSSDDDEPRRARLVRLAADAIAQCLVAVESDALARIALILCLEEPFRAGANEHDAIDDAIFDDIQAVLGVRFHARSSIVREGNAGALAALLLARELIDTGQIDQCVVGGVDSFVNVRDLRRFESSYRLKQVGVAQGFVPGEAAAFVRVAAHGAVAANVLAEIVGIGTAREDQRATVLSDGHPTGDALREAVQRALADGNVSEADIVFRVSDLNGEQYRGIESMLAMSRIYRTHRDEIPIRLPAAAIGETGAAAGALLLLSAALSFSSGDAPGPLAVCEASSDRGLRAGCVVRAAQSSPGSPMAVQRPPIAHIVAQHAEEVAHLREVRSVLVRAPHVGLSALARHDERIAAHLKGVEVAGESGARACFEALDPPGPGQLFAATVCAILSRDAQRLRQLIALAQAMPELRRGLTSAFGWVSPSSLSGITKDLLGATEAWPLEIGLSACAMHRVDPGPALERALTRDEPELAARALNVAADLGRRDLGAAVLAAMQRPELAGTAARVAVLLGERTHAPAVLQHWASQPGETALGALELLLKLLPAEQAHALLKTMVGTPGRMRDVIRAVGVAGDPHYVPWLMARMSEPEFARAAGDAFASITGADLSALHLDREEAADSSAELDSDDSLPWPAPDKIDGWWSAHGARFVPGTRYFVGQPPSPGHCLDVLKTGSQRRRAAAAQYLCLFNPGTPLFNVASPAWRQRRQLAQMSGA